MGRNRSSLDAKDNANHGKYAEGRTASQDGGGVDPCDDDLEAQHSYFTGNAC
jgi:hypothetical protein